LNSQPNPHIAVPMDAETPLEAAALTTPTDAPASVELFSALPLSDVLRENLQRAGFERPTPIQGAFIPKALAGFDVMGQAKTGTGKTAAFLIPIFQRFAVGAVAVKAESGTTQAIVLAPTRELAAQIYGETERLGVGLGLRSALVYGGSDYAPQLAALERGIHLLIGTPGRIMDHIRAGRLSLRQTRIVVLDEADRMLDMGFRRDIEFILRHCASERQTLLLSATFPDDILKLARRFMRSPLEVKTSGDKLTVDSVQQSYCFCRRDDKPALLLKILDEQRPTSAIVFCRTIRGTQRLGEQLRRLWINARDLHGDLSQPRREKILNLFRSGKLRVLVATDVAARGLDISRVGHIVNYDIPLDPEDYVHRIGRTGRMEAAGWAVTFVEREEGEFLTSVEMLINRQLKPLNFANLESRWWPKRPDGPQPEDAAAFTPEERAAQGENDDEAPTAPKRSRRNANFRTGRTRGRTRR
jgi:ATP-dependent RNA helicase DeaD